MRSKLPPCAHRAIALSAAAVVTTAALVVALAPKASAAPTAAPLPIAGAAGGPLVNVDGHVLAQPLVNNLTLPTLN
ncbi:hypothetical protein SSP24_54380 [Streptomyces spinoverrucosus]|uniref:Chaplin domain-containing protein n=1 Tax=Streptomyces spinoverrucosus TaxID=284043 RepID=A0A4Y3VMK1_9ACTN|nr:hypothetical protein [Streptomyces spinoverrucosus]GEC07783.1 hypothetical protein SSP24_54380 [Streptomyces spinoverrucosus]GHB53469.1 hypothetical protein GCM10010397_24370 [Streptomyces spinoverrucosus]